MWWTLQLYSVLLAACVVVPLSFRFGFHLWFVAIGISAAILWVQAIAYLDRRH